MESNNDLTNLSPQMKFYLANKEKIKEQKKEYYLANKEKFKEYYRLNKDNPITKEKIKTYRENNKIYYQNKTKEYISNNKGKVVLYNKEYRELNKDKLREYKRQYEDNKLKTDTTYKLKHSVRNLIRSSINKRGGKKLSRTEQILGCSYDEFKTYIESKFEDWMNWENYGNPKDGIYEPNKTWDFDHKIPVINGMTEAEILALNHHSNIQPLCSHNNRFIKRDN